MIEEQGASTVQSKAPGAPVLVVDDDEHILELVEMTLEDEGYRVETAINGAKALEMLESLRPSLILLDMRMPEVNGWEFAEAYRKLPGPHAPIIVITAGKDAPARAEEIGAAGFLGKPFDLDDLIEVVRQHSRNGHTEPHAHP